MTRSDWGTSEDYFKRASHSFYVSRGIGTVDFVGMAKSVSGSVCVVPSQEYAEFFDEDSPGWFIREKNVIGTRQRNKSRIWNLCC